MNTRIKDDCLIGILVKRREIDEQHNFGKSLWVGDNNPQVLIGDADKLEGVPAFHRLNN